MPDNNYRKFSHWLLCHKPHLLFFGSIVILGVLALATPSYSSTTIGTNMSTGGNLTVDSNATASGNLTVLGNTSLGDSAADTLTVNASTFLNSVVLYGGKIVSESDKQPLSLPIWNEDLTRYAGNPVITKTNIGAGYTFTADPTLLVVNNTLYMFFEALNATSALGELWMAESSDGFSWSNFQKVSVAALHWSHPQALIYNNRVYLFYNTNGDEGYIYYRSSPLSGFPSWSSESLVFNAQTAGWSHNVEFTIFENKGLWYLLGITSDANSVQDQWIRGRWATHFTTDWNSDSREVGNYPLVDVGGSSWASGIVEITSLNVGERIILFMGATRTSDSKRAIGAFAVNQLSPNSFEGYWLKNDHVFPLSASGWDSINIHRASAAAFKGNWVYAYDARDAQNVWQIGVATMPLLGSSITFPSGQAATSTFKLQNVSLNGNIQLANNQWFSIAREDISRNVNLFQALTSDEIISGSKLKLDVTKGLLGWYSLAQTDLKSSTLMADKSGNQHDGTITAGASAGFTTDRKSRASLAYDFDGANTMFNTGSDWIGASAFSLSVWVYPESTGENGRIIDNGKTKVRLGPTGDINVTRNGGDDRDTAGTLTLNHWTHVIVVDADGSEPSVYFNGVVQTLSGTAGTPAAGTTNVIIGNNSAQSGTFDGRLADLRVYNRALTTAEISQLYEQDNPGLEVNTLSVTEDTQSVRLVNLNVTSALSQGATVIMTFAHDNSDILSLYAEANGSGGVQNQRIGIGTTTPTSLLHIINGTATSTITVGDQSTGGKGACLKLRDADDAGWTYCAVLNGNMTCGTTSCE